MKGSNDKTIMMWDVKGKLSLDTDLAPSLSAFRDKLSGSSFDSVCGPVSLPYLFSVLSSKKPSMFTLIYIFSRM